MNTNRSLEELVQEVTSAVAALGEAQHILSRARNEEMTCLNRLNNAQKEIDALLLGLRKSAPRESSWGASAVQQYPKPM